jgi:serine/threonine protein kinase
LHTQILLGLNHMHTKKILHRDIKTLNVFLDDDMNVKLGDMGVAKVKGASLACVALWCLSLPFAPLSPTDPQH